MIPLDGIMNITCSQRTTYTRALILSAALEERGFVAEICWGEGMDR